MNFPQNLTISAK